jgi:hypothetical protein
MYKVDENVSPNPLVSQFLLFFISISIRFQHTARKTISMLFATALSNASSAIVCLDEKTRAEKATLPSAYS